MTGEEAVALLQGRCGQRSNLVTTVVSELNRAQQDKLERASFFPWFLNVDDTTSLDTVPNQEWVSLPADFLGFDDELGALFVDDQSGSADPWVPLTRLSYPLMKEQFRDPLTPAAPTATTPQFFDIIGTKLYFRPIPTVASNLRIIYAQKQALVANDGTTNLWLTHCPDWLTAEAGLMMQGFQRQNSEGGQDFAAILVTSRKRVYNETIERIEMGRMASMGEDE